MSRYPLIPDNSKFVFDGDSKVAGPTPAESWPSQFAALPINAGMPAIVNASVSGSMLANLESRYSSVIRQHSPAVTSSPAVLCIGVGVNDYYQPGFDLTSYLSRLKAYCSTARSDGFFVVLLTVDRNGWADAAGAKDNIRFSLNKGIREAQEYDVLVDTTLYFDDINDSTLYISDKLHYTVFGYGLLARIVSQALLSFGSPRMQVPRLNSPNSYKGQQTFRGVQVVDGPNGTFRGFTFTTDGQSRWSIGIGVTGNLEVVRYSQTGTAIDIPVYIDKDTGTLYAKNVVDLTP